MPVFDARNLTEHCKGEALLAMMLHATPKAREEARERGRMRLERGTMLAEAAPDLPGAPLAALRPTEVAPVT
ncbi:hypothetical protein LPC10_00075 [Methylorubrum sp. B1-46]|jgi:hypothetical protein|uniref:hypothetical protein n=1 Tax=Methylorubrum sp. B1-46 TaxID=2897334 RepID=UPI001E3714DB|nr:hypothetical protein [Methylorubrum sp. B1-46]UGB26087.1 hypothetical protein LPC10_00075 [Methylorubrum sp. B1-46]